MKKFLIGLLVAGLALGLSGMAMAEQLSDTQTFNFSCTVEKYIEVNPAHKTRNITTPSISPEDIYNPKSNYSFFKNSYNELYANCPFTISLAGDNGASDGLPILARNEVGPNRYGWDRLDTKLAFSYIINYPPSGGWKRITFGDNGYYGGGVKNGWSNNPYTFTEAPHDGEVGLELVSQATFLDAVPDWTKNNIWSESADASCSTAYTAWVVATYMAL